MARSKDFNWSLPDGNHSYDSAHLAVLMDIRDELKGLRSEMATVRQIFQCHNAQAIPRFLKKIQANTSRIKVSRRKAKVAT